MEEQFDINKSLVFAPVSGSSLLIEYPELKKYSEFKELNSREMLFVWYYAFVNSPIREKFREERVIALHSYKKAFIGKEDPVQRGKFEVLNFPEKITTAIDRMKRIRPSARMKAKMIQDKALDNYWKIVNVNLDGDDFKKDLGDGKKEIDWVKKNSYVSSVSKIISDLPGLVEQAESGFGIRETDINEKDAIEGTSLADNYHQQH